MSSWQERAWGLLQLFPEPRNTSGNSKLFCCLKTRQRLHQPTNNSNNNKTTSNSHKKKQLTTATTSHSCHLLLVDEDDDGASVLRLTLPLHSFTCRLLAWGWHVAMNDYYNTIDLFLLSSSLTLSYFSSLSLGYLAVVNMDRLACPRNQIVLLS